MPTTILGEEIDEELKEAFSSAKKTKQVKVELSDQLEPVTIRKPFPSPEDWRDNIVYMIMTDRFNNPKAVPKSFEEWDSVYTSRQGGTFEGIREKLGYLKELGVGAIWISPIHKNSGESYHGYGICDFLHIDPRFASNPNEEGLAEKEFIALVDEAHARGMYVILDIVLNHAGDVFGYHMNNSCNHDAEWSNSTYEICMYDDVNNTDLNFNSNIEPSQFRKSEYFRKQGKIKDDRGLEGDFYSLKEFKTELQDEYYDKPVWNILIEAYKHIIALTDIDGFRVDTFKHIEPEFARTFSNAIREYALSIGKENFFIFGECNTGDENLLAEYTGHNTLKSNGEVIVGADAQLDFPLRNRLRDAIKGFNNVSVDKIKEVFDIRKEAQKYILSSHGEASRFFVTFLDNHDDIHNRFYSKGYEDQLTLAIGCLFTLMGIPCIYYGTEIGLTGVKNPQNKPEDVREAAWGKENAFDNENEIYKQISKIAKLRNNEPAIRYGRQYFRQISGNNYKHFGYSKDVNGIIAFSRILNDREVVIVANTNIQSKFSGDVIVDNRLNYYAPDYSILYSNRNSMDKIKVKTGPVDFYEDNNEVKTNIWACSIHVELQPCEIQILAQL